nr:hypothetical protein [Porticoccus sp.]
MVNIFQTDTQRAPFSIGKHRVIDGPAIDHDFQMVRKLAAKAVITDTVAITIDIVGLEAGHQAKDIDPGHGA